MGSGLGSELPPYSQRSNGGLSVGNASYIVKLTEVCNLACSYCYYFKHRKDIKVPIMRTPLLESLIGQAAELSQHVWFIWHGGEPLMAGKDLFQTIVDLQKFHTPQKGETFTNFDQTNGTLLDDEWCSFFERNQFDVGVSLDGPEDLHNAYRVYPGGKGSFSAVMHGWKLLTESKTPAGALAVISRDSLGKAEEIFRFFLREGILNFNLLPCMEVDGKNGNLTPQSIQPAEYAQFLGEIYDLLIQEDNPAVKITDIFNILVALLGGKPSSCRVNGTCGVYVTVQSDGTVWPCDNFVGTEGFRLGNLQEQTLAEILSGGPRKCFQSWVISQRSACRGCELNAVCKGGCSWRHYQRTCLGLPPGSYWCDANKAIFRRIAKHLESTVTGDVSGLQKIVRAH